ncbi:HAUS augmin-like complex subunit 6 N-terminus-domain-containing protein [Aspergillus transmontanensis]|uniref:HAUS augmin-like complex subunit 6 N-terminus-domain-containing protein n=1 Tax=Aspergillus transmontanensis TaxID=1034304 RepID=A0A5N6VLR6_9EURO|nr:HAUS augmin-like complex subunit 6 N-terminus-domain-containing protein [Aspergillus transmontanensis]
MQSPRPPSRSKRPDWTPQPPVAVFVRNLQLLQLDSRDDWPGITVRSLSPSSQNQRQRVKAIEWALYQLVALWDPETARDKLRPFFPPLEPLQSVNLRAALFRVLSELKKNGDLGKETILRKSMLDDCKGEKFDELLAVFSTAVLRKALAASADEGLGTPAMKLSMASGLTQQEYQRMLPLILAHRVSLREVGERRSRVRDTHERFSQLLDYKKSQLELQSQEERPQIAGEANFDELAQKVKTNCLRNADWADTLLYGGARSSSDAFLELPFSTAWSKAKASTVEDLRTNSAPDLLIDLETRITRQRARLQRWHQYHSSMLRHERGERMNTIRSPPLAFRDHQALTVASIARAVREPVERISPKADDRALLFSMTEALARIEGTHRSSSRATPLHAPVVDADRRMAGHESLSSSNTSSPQLVQQDATAKSTPSGSVTSEADDSIGRSSSPSLQLSSDLEFKPPQRKERNTYNLIERTRKSMSLVPPPQSTPRPRESLRPRRPRPSFPVNQFELPERQTPEISRASTPRDELFEEEADYNSVFKSRPRVAHSPISSPAVHVSPVEDFELGMDMDSRLDMSEAYSLDSPLPRRRR